MTPDENPEKRTDEDETATRIERSGESGRSSVDTDITQRTPGARDSSHERQAPSIGDLPKSRFGDFEIESLLGRGGQGAVYRARDLKLQRTVALKILSGLARDDHDQLQRFRREAEVAARLEHPAICGVIDAGTEDGVPYIAMRYVEGIGMNQEIAAARATRDARDATAGEFETTGPNGGDSAGAQPSSKSASSRRSKMSRDEIDHILAVFERIARALHVAHEAGILHRDIKPANIMIDKNGEPVILDFGLASDQSENAVTLTQTGDVLGTPAYMSPEQLSGTRGRLDARSDVFSLGATLYERLTLERAFQAPTRERLFQAILTKPADDPRRFNPGISDDLRVVLECALEKDSDKRYATAAAFADDLAAVRASRPIAARKIGLVGRVVRWGKRRKALAALTIVLVMGVPTLSVLFGYIWANQPNIEAQRQAQIDLEVEKTLDVAFYEHHHGDPERSLELFTRALGIAPQSIEAAAGLVLTHIKRGDFEAAENVIEKTGRTPESRGALMTLRQDVRQGLGHSADRSAAPTRPWHELSYVEAYVEGLRALSEGERSFDDDEKAEQAFDRAANLMRHAVNASPRPRRDCWFQYVHALGHQGSPEHVREVVAAILSHWPDEDTTLRWAAYLLVTVDPERAIEYCDEIIRRSYESVSAHTWKACALEQLHRFDEAADEACRYLEIVPRSIPGNALLAKIHAEAGRIDESVAIHRFLMELVPNASRYAGRAGSMLAEAGRYDEAREFFEVALARVHSDKERAEIEYNYGNAYIGLNRPVEAIGHFESSMRLATPDADLLNNLGVAHLRNGEREKAIAYLRRGLAVDPSHPASMLSLANVYSMDDATAPEAIFCYRSLIDRGFRVGFTSMRLAQVLMRIGQTEEAMQLYGQVIDSAEVDAPTAYEIGCDYQSNNDLVRAKAAYRRAVTLDPNLAEAWCNLGSIELFEKNYADGWKASLEGHKTGLARGKAWQNPSAMWLRDATIRHAKDLDARGLVQEAVDVLTKTLRLLPEDPALEALLDDLQ